MDAAHTAPSVAGNYSLASITRTFDSLSAQEFRDGSSAELYLASAWSRTAGGARDQPRKSRLVPGSMWKDQI